MLIRLLFLCIISVSLFAQPARRDGRPAQLNDGPKPIYFSTYTIPGDSLQRAFITYRIPYNNIVFQKAGDMYSSSLTMIFEVFQDGNIVGRESSKEAVKVDDYDKTNSTDQFLQGYVEVMLEPGEYRVRPTVATDNSSRTVSLPPLLLSIKDPNNYNIIEPIVVVEKEGKILVISCRS